MLVHSKENIGRSQCEITFIYKANSFTETQNIPHTEKEAPKAIVKQHRREKQILFTVIVVAITSKLLLSVVKHRVSAK